MQAWKLFYDGECNLCNASQLSVVQWARKAGQPLETEILQSDEASDLGIKGDAMVLIAGAERYEAHLAWLKLARLGPLHIRALAFILGNPIGLPFLRIGYRLVAKYRYRLFGKRACPIPTSKGSS